MSLGEESPVKRYPRAGQVVLLLIVAIILQVATGGTALAIACLALGDAMAGVAMLKNVWILVPAISLSNCLTLALGMRGSKEGVRQFLRVRAFQPQLLPAVALTCVGLPVLLSEADNRLVQFVQWVSGTEIPPPEMFDFRASPVGALVLLVCVAPLTEEYLFRGLILRGLLTHHSRVKAVVFSAVAFGTFHLNLRQGFLALVIGLVFGWWYIRTRSVGPGMVGHAIFNGLAWALAQIPDIGDAYGLTPTPGTMRQVPLWLVLVGVALVTGGAWSFNRQARVIGTDPSPPPPPMAEPPFLFEPPLLERS
jgi:membrane protease YdiL (CAAX protease family)